MMTSNTIGTSSVGQVNIHEDYEILYWCGLFGCRPNELRDAVGKVGDLVDAVGREIQAGKDQAGSRLKGRRRSQAHKRAGKAAGA